MYMSGKYLYRITYFYRHSIIFVWAYHLIYTLKKMFNFASLQPISSTNTRPIRYNELSNDTNSFSFSNATLEEMVTAVQSIKSNYIGYNDIYLKLIKMILPTLSPLITHIFNSILTTSHIPQIWKTSRVILIHKNSFP